MSDKHEIVEEIRGFLASKEFKYQFKIWSVETCKDVLAGYWKIIATVSIAFVAVISYMLSFVFGHFNHTIDKLQTSTASLTQSVVRLESTVNLMYDDKYNINKDRIYDFKKRNLDGQGS